MDAAREVAAFRMLTWNLQGREGVDVEGIAQHLTRMNVDLVAIQEVQRRQVELLAAVLKWHHVWAFKHFPLVAPAEGAAILSPHLLDDVETFILRPAVRTSWKRRIALVARVGGRANGVVVANIHLSPDGPVDRRNLEVERLVAGLRATYSHPDRDVVVAGDVNCEPPSATLDALESAGWVDAWASTPPDSRTGVGPTNWTPGPRAGRSPTQRIDQIFVPRHWICRRAVVPADYEPYSTLSDHLPLLVEAERPIGVI